METAELEQEARGLVDMSGPTQTFLWASFSAVMTSDGHKK